MPDGILDWSFDPPRVLHPREATSGMAAGELAGIDHYARRCVLEYDPETMRLIPHYHWVDPNSGIVVGYGEKFERA